MADADVVVIGAGAAGLACAQRVACAGRSVVVVEARDRIVGRIHTLRPAGWPHPIEAGAEFIHGEPQETWNLIRAGGLSTYAASEESWQAADGRLRPFEFGPLWQKVFGRL